ncbi:hypothetical protein DUNSADRAFT_12875 [Dunaliella salina]|uniref:Uncharacterized protein n=1 Tax=Dunaliella salina TaxID=3046 RepID=A0ABQ7H3K6_DUNSA|nr:hypothetical protein DUNSADRAFT_12875 [Dunaliella salina]|eukprot:KAF5841431.1 hypothetical protein DUNSADRAFT_12875 [Dunaliella salina]
MLSSSNVVSGPIAKAVWQCSTCWKVFPPLVSSHNLVEEALVCVGSRNSSSSVDRGAEELSTTSCRDTNELSQQRGWLHRAVKQKGDESFTEMLERRQKAWYAKLSNWEKAYLAAGALGGGLYAYSKVDWDGSKAAAAEAKRAKEAQLLEDRLKAVPAFLQGKSFLGDENSPLEGASPAEIEALAETARQSMPAPQLAFSSQWAKGPLEEDPYDGLSPEEIDALVESQGRSS